MERKAAGLSVPLRKRSGGLPTLQIALQPAIAYEPVLAVVFYLFK